MNFVLPECYSVLSSFVATKKCRVSNSSGLSTHRSGRGFPVICSRYHFWHKSMLFGKVILSAGQLPQLCMQMSCDIHECPGTLLRDLPPPPPLP